MSLTTYHIAEGQDLVFTAPGEGHYYDLVDGHGDVLLVRIARSDEPAGVHLAQRIARLLTKEDEQIAGTLACIARAPDIHAED